MPAPPRAATLARVSRTTSHPVTDSLRAGLVVGVLSFVIGALTAWAQTVLPYSLYSLANSANAWVLVIVVLILGVRAGPALATLLGSASSVLLMLGFTAGLALYGKPYDPCCGRCPALSPGFSLACRRPGCAATACARPWPRRPWPV